MDKKTIRAEIIKRIKEIGIKERETKSQQIIENLINCILWKKAEIIATTMPMSHEINTTYLIDACWESQKTVVVPKCNHDTREMQFYKITSYSDLQKGYFGIMEPIEDRCEKISKDLIELIVVPGVAFTKEGHRLGYGGGYYDRYLENYKYDFLALAFDAQMIDYIPTEKHDLPMPLIITESNTYKQFIYE